MEFPKKPERTSEEFPKRHQQISNSFQTILIKFPKHSQSIYAEFPKYSKKIAYRLPKNILMALIGRNLFRACFVLIFQLSFIYWNMKPLRTMPAPFFPLNVSAVGSVFTDT